MGYADVSTEMSKRTHFSTTTILQLRDRAGNRCSNPQCGRPTSGPAKDTPSEATILGVASHISAAMPGGPRYDQNQDDDVRHSIDNGIWLCQQCSTLIDKNGGNGDSRQLLMRWKHIAESKARKELEQSQTLQLEQLPAIQAISYVNLPRL